MLVICRSLPHFCGRLEITINYFLPLILVNTFQDGFGNNIIGVKISMKKIFMTASLVAGLTLITSCSVKQLSENEKNSDYNNTIYRGRNTHNLIVLDNKLDKVIKNQEHIIEQNEEMLKILNKQN